MFPFPYFIIYVLVVEILLQYRTADAEIKILTVEHPGVENAVPGAGQNIATYALATTRNIFIVLISSFSVYPTFFSFFLFLLQTLSLPFNCVSSANPLCLVGPRNKTGHPDRHRNRLMHVIRYRVQ